MKNLLLSAGLLIVSLAGLAQPVAKNLTAANGEYIGFYQYTPPDYNDGQKHPLIIFLHGIGERGDGKSQLSMVLNNPIPAYLTASATMKFSYKGVTASYVVLAPQLSTNYGDWQDFYVDEMINYAKANLNIDQNRIYLTGLSLGGGGTWHYASSSLAHAQQLAAIAPVCGTCSMVSAVNIASANLPVWAFHAEDDATVGVGCTTGQVQGVNNLKPGLAIQTIYGSGQHYIWGRAYDMGHPTWDAYPSGTVTQNPNVYEWFLQFTRGGNAGGGSPTPPPNPTPTPGNPPVASAGSDVTITLPTSNATLDGSASHAASGSLNAYQWQQLTGPSQATIASPKSATTGISNLVQGTYTFKLSVWDNAWIPAYANVTVTVNAAPTPPTPASPPVANAGGNINLTLPTSNATLDGTASSAPSGSINAYEWTQLTGPSQATIASPKTATTGISNLAQGTYTFKLAVWDNNWIPAYANVTVTVNAAPVQTPAPVAKAGGTVTITLPTNSVNLDGRGSTGNISSYSWSMVSGPSQITLSNPAAAATTVSNLVQGTYVLKLAVSDATGVTGIDNATIIVNAAPAQTNQPPVSKAGSDIAVTWPVNSVTLNGTGSYDPGGAISSYAWTKLSGPASGTINNPSAAYTTVSNLDKGTYKFQLTVKDNTGASNSSTVTVVINQPPVVSAGPDVAISSSTSSVTLNGSATDPDGSVVAYQWTQISGPAGSTIASPTTASTTVSNLAPGTYQFLLTAWDNYWVPASGKVTVTVGTSSSNTPPVANAGNNIAITYPNNTVSLVGTGSYDPNGTIVSYAWTKVSGPNQGTINNANGATATAVNLAPGTYKFQLTVTDNGGATNSATVTVFINQPPVAVAGPNVNLTLPTNSTYLIGSGSYDPDGSILVYKWEKVGGPTQFSMSSTNTANVTVSNLVQGTYTFRLTVWDNYWYPASSDITVTVNGTGVTAARAATAPAVEAKTTPVPASNQLSIYPNPASDVINLKTTAAETGNGVLNIYDAAGKLVKKQPFNKNMAVYQQSLSVGNLTPGVYHVEMVVNNKTKLTNRFVKQ